MLPSHDELKDIVVFGLLSQSPFDYIIFQHFDQESDLCFPVAVPVPAKDGLVCVYAA